MLGDIYRFQLDELRTSGFQTPALQKIVVRITRRECVTFGSAPPLQGKFPENCVTGTEFYPDRKLSAQNKGRVEKVGKETNYTNSKGKFIDFTFI